MEIKRYEPWMKDQVIDLFVAEYGVTREDFWRLFTRFYEHPFQESRCVRIVSVEGQQVAGFQSFFHWPLVRSGTPISALQSGNSLVHPDFRGQRLFARMLDFIHDPACHVKFDLLIGFPVEASYNSFIRNKWLNPFNLQWYVKPMTPVLSLFRGAFPEKYERTSFTLHLPETPDTIVHTDHSGEFGEYRSHYQTGKYFRFHVEEGGCEAVFEAKIRIQRRILRELIVGNVILNDHSPEWLSRALELFSGLVRKSGRVSFVSIAVNEQSALWKAALTRASFRPIEKKIHFIAKGPMAEQVTDWSNWWMFRGDIDTW